jgi:serine protease inhibitor
MINFTDMKHFIIGLMLATAFISCDKNDPSTKFPPRKDIVLTKSQSEILHNGSSFAFNMLRELYPIESQELFISPFSLGTAMSMLANGADGETYKEISSALGYEGYDLVDINSTYRTLNECLLGVDTSTKLAIANGAWLRSDLEFAPAFTLSLTSNYEANVGNLDSSALDEINSWADKNTNGMIPKIFDRIDPDMAFILANALYFKGEWSRKFDKSVTGSKLFHSLDRNPKEMKFMKGDIPCKYSYSYELKSALCEIPFGNKAFALDILLPDDGVTLRSLVNSLNVRNWEAVVYDLLGRSEYVEIPKLDLSYSGDETFKTALQALGLSRLLIRIPPISVSSVPLSFICQRSYRRLVSRWMRMGRKQHLSQWHRVSLPLSALLKDLLSITRLYSPFAKLPLAQSSFWEHTGGYKL